MERIAERARWLVPVAFFAGFVLFHVGQAGGWPAENLFANRWDIGHYQSIAEAGYEVFPCRPDRPDGNICGNPGWMFGWPVFVRALSPLFGGVETAIRWLPLALTLASFVVLFLLAARTSGIAPALVLMLGMTTFPGSFYLLTGFPYALLILLQALYLYVLFVRPAGSTGSLALLGGAISTCYPTACLFAVVPALHLLRESKTPMAARTIARMAALVAPFAIGPLALCLFFWITEGDPLLFLHFQEKYGRDWAAPFGLLVESFATRPLIHPENLSFFWYAVLGLTFFVRDREGRWPQPELAAYACLLLFFSPSTGSMQSIYRHLVLAYPALFVLATSPRPIALKVGYLLLGGWLSSQYLLPAWLRGTLV